MNKLQGELRTNATALNIEILGVNQIGDSASNPLITLGRTLPWLQDTEEDQVWRGWGVIYRDVRILDSQNQLYAVYNLTTNDLSRGTNYATLKQLFLEAAKAVDADRDNLSDDWELRYFGNLDAKPGDDPDGDGVDNFSEFAFGTDPASARSSAGVRQVFQPGAAQGPISLSFRRRAGGFLRYELETSTDLANWLPASPVLLAIQNPRLLYNGAGLSEVNSFVTDTAMRRAAGFVRVRATPAN